MGASCGFQLRNKQTANKARERGGKDKTETQLRGSGKESKERGQKVVREGTQKHNGDTPRQIKLPAWSEERRFEADR